MGILVVLSVFFVVLFSLSFFTYAASLVRHGHIESEVLGLYLSIFIFLISIVSSLIIIKNLFRLHVCRAPESIIKILYMVQNFFENIYNGEVECDFKKEQEERVEQIIPDINEIVDLSEARVCFEIRKLRQKQTKE